MLPPDRRVEPIGIHPSICTRRDALESCDNASFASCVRVLKNTLPIWRRMSFPMAGWQSRRSGRRLLPPEANFQREQKKNDSVHRVFDLAML